MNLITRFISLSAALAICLTTSRSIAAENDFPEVKTQITKQHDEAVKRLQDWIYQVSIAAEDRGYPEGADYIIKLLKDAGFQRAERADTDDKPGVFATLAPDEYYVIESSNPKIVGFDGAVMSFVEYLYELAHESENSREIHKGK